MHVESIRPTAQCQMNKWHMPLSSDVARWRQYSISKLVKLILIISDFPLLQPRIVCLCAIRRNGMRRRVTPNENIMFDIFKITLNVSDGEIYFVNNFSLNITLHERNYKVWCPWHFLQKKLRCGLSGLKDKFQELPSRSTKNNKDF